MQVVVLIGLQGSGKTTFYRERFERTHLRLSKDLIRSSGKQRKLERRLREALAEGRSVVIDNTNPSREERAPWIAIAKEFGAEVVGYHLAAPVEECLRRNAAREGRERVPDVGFFAALGRFERPSPDEGFDRLHVLEDR